MIFSDMPTLIFKYKPAHMTLSDIFPVLMDDELPHVSNNELRLSILRDLAQDSTTHREILSIKDFVRDCIDNIRYRTERCCDLFGEILLSLVKNESNHDILFQNQSLFNCISDVYPHGEDVVPYLDFLSSIFIRYEDGPTEVLLKSLEAIESIRKINEQLDASASLLNATLMAGYVAYSVTKNTSMNVNLAIALIQRVPGQARLMNLCPQSSTLPWPNI